VSAADTVMAPDGRSKTCRSQGQSPPSGDAGALSGSDVGQQEWEADGASRDGSVWPQQQQIGLTSPIINAAHTARFIRPF